MQSNSRIGFADEDLRQRVESYLLSKRFDCFRELDVDVSGGVVTLSGVLKNEHMRHVALNCCRRVAGVQEIVDHIELVNSTIESHTAAGTS